MFEKKCTCDVCGKEDVTYPERKDLCGECFNKYVSPAVKGEAKTAEKVNKDIEEVKKKTFDDVRAKMDKEDLEVVDKVSEEN